MLCVFLLPLNEILIFKRVSFHYSMPATLNLDYSVFSKSQKHSKRHAQESLAAGRMIFIIIIIIIPVMSCSVVSIQGAMQDVSRHYCIIPPTNQ